MDQVDERVNLGFGSAASERGLAAVVNALIGVATAVMSKFGYRINRLLPKDGSEAMTAALPIATYTVATRPNAASVAWSIIAVTDGGAGAEFQGSNGTTWVNLG